MALHFAGVMCDSVTYVQQWNTQLCLSLSWLLVTKGPQEAFEKQGTNGPNNASQHAILNVMKEACQTHIKMQCNLTR